MSALCPVGQLTVSLSPHREVADGTTIQTILVRNASGSTCAVAGRVGVQTIDGQLLATWAGDNQLLESGQQATLRLALSSECTDVSARAVRLRIGLMSRPVSGVRYAAGCGGLRIASFRSPSTAAPTSAIGTMRAVTVTYSVPSTVRAGSPLRYTVTLTNPTSITVSLRDCPTFTEYLFDDADATMHEVRMTGRLNCAGAGGSLAPQSSRTFEMAMTVPAEMPAGRASMSWPIDRYVDGPAFGQMVTVQS